MSYDRTPMVTVELHLRPSPPDDASPFWWGDGMLAFYDGPARAEGRIVKVWEKDLHEVTCRSTYSAHVKRADDCGWVLILTLAHDKARQALAVLQLPDAVEMTP